MTHILIIESNPASKTAQLQALAGAGYGDLYCAALKAIAPDLAVTTISPYDGDTISDLSSFDGAAFTGSSVDWNTDDPRAAPLANVMRACFEAGMPVIGSCNGMQLAASILGGSAAASPNGREDGLATGIRLTDDGRAHPMMQGRSDGFAVPCTHRDEVIRMPDHAVRLAGNDHSPVQAFAICHGGVDFWGMQYHPEVEAAFFGRYLGGLGRIDDATATDLQLADHDAEAARRLNTTTQAQQPDIRLTELRNWLSRFA